MIFSGSRPPSCFSASRRRWWCWPERIGRHAATGQIRYRRLKRFPQKGGFCEGLESNGEGRGPRDFQSRTGPDCRPSANVGAGFSAIGEGFASRRRAGSHLRRWGDRMTIREAAQLLRERSVSAVELTTSAIGRIERRNPKLNAFITITADQALE